MTDVELINLRDLGGAPLRGGGVLPAGVVYRSGGLARMSPPTASRLVARTGLRTFVDLRTDAEHERDGALTALTEVGVRVVRHPMDEGRTAARAARSPGPDDYAQSYVAMLDLATSALGAIVDLVATPGRLPLAFGCSAGKDRTGVVAALLLLALGAGDAWIVDDYARSTPELARCLSAFEARWVNKGLSREEYAARLVAHPRAMRGFLAAVRAAAPSVDALFSSRGVSADRIRRASLAILTSRGRPERAHALNAEKVPS